MSCEGPHPSGFKSYLQKNFLGIGWHASWMLFEGQGQYLWSDRPVCLFPFLKKGTRECAQIITLLTPLGKFLTFSDWLSNLGFKRTNKNSALAVEQGTSSLPLQASLEFTHPVIKCFVDLERKCFLGSPVGDTAGIWRTGVITTIHWFPIWPKWDLCSRRKIKHVLIVCWTLPMLPQSCLWYSWIGSHGAVRVRKVSERAAKCEAAGLKMSTSKSEAMVLCQETVGCPLRGWECFAAPSILWSLSHVMGISSLRWTGSLVQHQL